MPRRLPAAAFLLLLLPWPLVAQSTGAMLEFEKFADIYGSRLVAAFDSIPAANYNYRPTPVQQTVGYIAQHLENANYTLCGSFGHVTPSRTAKDAMADTVKARWPKDTLVARLRASVRFCDLALDRVPAVSSADVAGSLLAFETDLAEHYSQIAVYMRLLGLVPPSALPRRFPPVVALPATALAPYVGEYELVPGLDLVVTVRNAALWVRSTNNGANVRLWPESPSAFFTKEVDVEVTFERDANGRVTGLTFRQYGRSRPARKIR
ncbi:MAG: DUF3471 domain-containing protein [Gemmatimonadaceae bacterium]